MPQQSVNGGGMPEGASYGRSEREPVPARQVPQVPARSPMDNHYDDADDLDVPDFLK